MDDFYGVNANDYYAAVMDQLYYNEQEDPMPDWLKAQNDYYRRNFLMNSRNADILFREGYFD